MNAQRTEDRADPDWMDRLRAMDADELAEDIEQRLEDWQEDLAQMRERAQQVPGDARQEMRARFQQMEGTVERLEEQLERVREAGKEEAGELRASLTALAIGLRRDLDRLKGRLEQR